MKDTKLKATIVIPTYNGQDHLRAIFVAIFKQKVDFDYEVLVIDSGSTDNTVDIIKKFESKHENIRFIEIPNSEYGHGKTRDYAAHEARGEIVVYISHDAIPAHPRWLYEMVKPFELNEKIVGVMGKQVPRPKCFPLLKYEIRSTFRNFGPDFGTTIFYKDDFVKKKETYDSISFYSDSNSAARRSYLTGILPYKHVNYAEDQVLGRDIIDAGYFKVYAPRASVIHSNDLKLSEYRHRMFDEALALRKNGIQVRRPSRKAIVKMIITGSLKDGIRTIMDTEYSPKRKVYWFILNPFFHIEKWRGIYAAATIKLNDSKAIGEHSLESKRNTTK
ncbi:MAG: Rhamnosyltransferase [Candidatus Saccharibacteria bacterium]|nr:Rhamnosyltransferase [Candidatus Saccharibacteria bacterium]